MRQDMGHIFGTFANYYYLCTQIFLVMKTSSATVRLVLKRNRKNRFGEYPVYLCICYKGRVEKATGVCVQEKYWNESREEIKGSCPNAPVLNKMLLDIKSRVLEAKNRFEFEGRKYTPQMLLNADVSVSSSDFWTVCQKLMDDRRLKSGTRHLYKFAYQRLVKFMGRKDIEIEELTIGVMKDFGRSLEGTIKECTIKGTFGCIAAVWNYAIDRKIVSDAEYPFKEFKYNKLYKECPRDYYLEKSHIVRLRDYFLDQAIERNGNMWHYRDGAEEQLENRRRDLFGLMWFLMCYKLNGSAPIEIALLKPADCKRVIIGGEEYYSIDIKRQKTGTPVHIRLKRDLFTIICLEHYLMYSGEYVYPIVKGEGLSEKQILGQSHKYANLATGSLRRAFQVINGQIARDNVENGCNEPLVDVERVVMYTARHSFSMHYLTSPGSTVAGLASLLSRSPNTISTYISQITRDEDVAGMVDCLPI